jgi:hypothetical protein
MQLTEEQLIAARKTFKEIMEANPDRYPNLRRFMAQRLSRRRPWWKRLFGLT